MRSYYVLNYQSHDPDTPTYMEALSGENADEYYKAMDDEIQSLMRRDTWKIVSKNSLDDQNVLTVTCYFNCKRKPDWTIRKFKAQYFLIGYFQKRLPPGPLNSYFSVVQWVAERLMLIFQCILGLQIQSIDFTNAFSQSDIPSGEPVFIELPSDFNSDGGQCDVVLRLNKRLHGQAEASQLW